MRKLRLRQFIFHEHTKTIIYSGGNITQDQMFNKWVLSRIRKQDLYFENSFVYMPLYKYVSFSTARKILEGSIRFTQPGAFNDPFELLPQFINPKNINDIAPYALRLDCFGPRRKALFRQGLSIEDKNKSDIQARSIVQSLNEVVGILCLSKNPDSLLMWGHYSDEYRGAIIEFDESHPFFEGKFQVTYRKNRPIYDLADFLDTTFPISDLCIKPNAWSYEKEVRVVRNLKDCQLASKPEIGLPIMTMQIPIDCISGVIIGERMPIENQREIWSRVKNTNISLCLAAISNWEYTFRKDPIKFSGPLNGSPMINPRTAHIFSEESDDFGEIARWMLKNHAASPFVNFVC